MEPSYGEESFFQASHLPRVPSGALDSAPLRRRSFGGGGDGLSMPDEDLLTGEDDSPVQRTFFLSAAMWWVLTSLALCAVLLGAPWSPGFAPWKEDMVPYVDERDGEMVELGLVRRRDSNPRSSRD